MSKKASNSAPVGIEKPAPPPAPPKIRKGFIHYACPYCGSIIEESFNSLPLDWMCYKCGKLYSIMVLPDEVSKDLRKSRRAKQW
jgi:phage FluMu protein Com